MVGDRKILNLTDDLHTTKDRPTSINILIIGGDDDPTFLRIKDKDFVIGFHIIGKKKN